MHYPTEVDFIKNFNHAATVNRYETINTIPDAYNTGFVKLMDLQQAYSREAPRFLIESWLMQFALYTGLPVNKEQIKELAFYMYEELFMLNLAELNLFFKYLKKGKYGSFYGRIDPAELLRWCREYRKERGEYICKLPSYYESEELRKSREEYQK